MSDLVEQAHEIDGLILNDPATGTQIGLFVGGVLPHVAVPDAPYYAWYFRNDGSVYRLSAGSDGSIAGNWQQDVIGGGGPATGCVPYWNELDVADHIPLVGGQVPFWDENGTPDFFSLTSC